MKIGFTLLLTLLIWGNHHVFSQSFCQYKKANSLAGETENYVYKEYRNQNGKYGKLNILLTRPVDNLPVKKRPLVIGLHGSGFMNLCISTPCHLKYNRDVLTKNFTSQGFITASIQYRLSSPFDFNPLNVKDIKLIEASYKAVQDVREAIRFIFENAGKFDVDTENVFIIGTSAGAITALNTVFLDNSEVPNDLLDKFGELEKREKIKGVISLSGAVYDLSYLDGDEKIPLMLVHGEKDFIVPIDKGFYLKIKHLTPVYGGRAILEQAQNKSIPAKGFFYDFGHSYPEDSLSDIFKNANEFIRTNLRCGL